MKDWTRYYDAAGADPRATLLDALARFDDPGFAVDLGCGTGRNTFELLRRGWRVLAIDAQEEALRRVRAAVGGCEPLDTQVGTFEDATLPPCDLVNASFALPSHTRGDVERLLAGYDPERLDEEVEDSTTVVGDAKQWHLFHVVARKR